MNREGPQRSANKAMRHAERRGEDEASEEIKTTRIAGGLLQPYKGLLPASV